MNDSAAHNSKAEPIKHHDLALVDANNYKKCFASCVVLSHDNRILIQYRDSSFKNFPNALAFFGGHIEAGESPIQGLVRELHEELGAKADPETVISLGAFTEDATQHQHLVFAYFWQDKMNSITGCYEGEAKYFKALEEILEQSHLLSGDRWMLKECRQRGLL